MRSATSVAVATLLLMAAPAARGGESTTPSSTVDAGLLLDLDLLDSADYRRDREVARRQGLLERLRLLESERMPARGANPSEAAQGTAGATARPPARSPSAEPAGPSAEPAGPSAEPAGKDKK